MISILSTIQRRIEGLFDDPHLSKIELMRKQVVYTWALASFISIVFLTTLAYSLRANVIAYYGIVLIILYLLELPFYRKNNFDFYHSIFLALLIITTFIFILIFGGYTNSAGLVFVGLTCVMSSLLLNSKRVAYILFFIYVATILGLAFLDPYLIDHPDVTPAVNLTFFILNTIWMSASMMFFIISYLTERNKYQIAETNRLHELDEVRSQLFTNITHEFRTPITLIKGMAGQIKSTDSKTLDAIIQIRDQSDRLLRLVNQILDLARIDSKSMQLHLAQANVIEFLNFHIESLRSAAEAKEINYISKHTEEVVMMDFDSEKLETIIINLITNAIKFTPEKGTITIRIFKTNNNHLTIEVSDTGIGINNDDQEKIFQRFFQVKTDKYVEGNGIGLTLVREFVNLMAGRIVLTSEIGVGSKFQIILPITNKAISSEIIIPQQHKEESSIDRFEETYQELGTKPHLLIIDDNPDIVNYLEKLLKDQYRIIVAKNGIDGLELASENVPDIIISDVMMPGMDGFEFLKMIKSDMATSHIPVLMLTAKADRDSRLEGLELGAEAYLVKPFDREELFIRLKKLLDLRKILHERYRSLYPGNRTAIESDDIEDKFMTKVRSIIDINIDNEHFNIQKLCKEIGMSHTQLYRKFSAVTDITINKYIKQYRLHKSMDLLSNTNLNISQVALEVGMPNLAYFSRVFKEEFHINPSNVHQSRKTIKRDAE